MGLESWKLEEKRVRELLEAALASLEDAMQSGIWSYTREYELGKLAVAESILAEELKELKVS